MDDVALILGVAAGVCFFVYVTAIAVKQSLAASVARRLLRELEERDPYAIEQGVTLLQPILSGDPELEATLRQNVDSLPACVRFLWLIDEDDAEGRRTAERILGDEGEGGRSSERIVVKLCPPTSPTENPKTAKLAIGLERVQTPVVGVLDDDTTLPSASLAAAVGELEVCDLATGLPAYREGRTFWSSLVSDFVNDNACTTYLPLLRYLPPLSINGMFYVTRVETLRSLGGFDAIRDRLCDDYALARLYRDAGKTIRQTPTPQYVATSVSSPGAYFRLMHRWVLFGDLLVRDQKFSVQATLVAMLGLPPILLWATLALAVAAAIVEPWPWSLAPPVVVAFWICIRFLLRQRLNRRLVTDLPPYRPLRSFLVELLQPVHLAHALVRRTILWRGRRIRVESDGRFREIVASKGSP